MKVSIETLKAVGASAELILAAVEMEQAAARKKAAAKCFETAHRRARQRGASFSLPLLTDRGT